MRAAGIQKTRAVQSRNARRRLMRGCVVRRGRAEMEYYAKSPAGTEHKTLREHIEETVRCAEAFFEQYGRYFSDKEKKLILFACRFHDIGKANYIFQTLVNPALEKTRQEQISHGFLSALLLSKEAFFSENPQFTQADFSVLLTAVYYHHTRPDVYDGETLKTYCEQFYLSHVREYLQDDTVTLNMANRNFLLFSDRNQNAYIRPKESVWCEYMLVKGMLNKFDWTVSAGNEAAETASDLADRRLCGNIEEKWAGKFRPAQKFMMENRERNIVMTAPTGSGKTEAALLWLNGEKGFYTLPLKVSSDAIYRRIRKNYRYEDAALLHSDSLNDYLKEAEDLKDGYRNYEKAKRFSCPLTVCTVDQLFRFVYKALGTEIFAATLKYSKIVIDEIQSYEPRVVAALLFGLSEIKRMGGKFAVITATFPPVLQYFMRESGLMEDRDYVWHDFAGEAEYIRHRLKIVKDDFDYEEIADAARCKKVLVICNTVSKAQHVYQKLTGEGLNPGLLHSRYIRAHRKILERKIMDFSAGEQKTGIWVTTQIVEASLDIDFDILYTEMCTADSLLQRMGRCNRAGKKDTSEPNIIVYHNHSGRGTIYDKDIYDRSIKLLQEKDGELLSEAGKTAYINAVYDVDRIKRTKYFKQIEKNLAHLGDLWPAEYNMEESRKNFRGIQSITVIPENIYLANLAEIEEIQELFRTGHADKGIRSLKKARLAELTLSINPRSGLPGGIDKETIALFDIHRTRLKYDFNGETGPGLLLDKMEDEEFLL